MELHDYLTVSGSVLAFLLIIVLAVVYLRSEVRKANAAETEALVETRGKVNDDLREEVADLKNTVAEMQGQIDMLRSFKTQEITDGVIAGVKELIKELH